MIRWLMQRLKSCYPFSEIARIIDLDRAEMVAHAQAIQQVDAAIRQLGENQSRLQGELCSLVREVVERVDHAERECRNRHVSSEREILAAFHTVGGELRESVSALGAAHEAGRKTIVQTAELVSEVIASTAESRQVLGGAMEKLDQHLSRTSEQSAEASARLEAVCESLRSAAGELDAAQRAGLDELRTATGVIGQQQTELRRLLLERLDQLEAGDAAKLAELEAAIGEQGQAISSLLRDEFGRTRDLNRETWRGEVKPAVEEAHVAIAKMKPAIEAANVALADRIDENLAACRAGQWSRTSGDERTDPEVCLLEYLAPFVPHRVAIDIGANEGLLALRLARAGYRVIAFEPNPALAQTLARRAAESPGFTLRHEAIGAADGTMELKLVEDRSGCDRYRGRLSLYSSLTTHSLTDDLAFAGGVTVPVRSIDSLRKARELPSTVGVLKIDTEGYDLEVVRGMGSLRSHVVMAEFWDKEMAFGRGEGLYQIPDLVEAMEKRGFYHYIILHRDPEGTQNVSFYANQAQSVPGSWGNVVFLRNYELFEKAVGWCSSRFPRTVFRPGRG